ncbi:MAG: 50S ribosomal protein L24e [Nanoarchaeota archaeon]|nr:50S ribosomal protein L24e [Nanoarchaeota archaeon]
MAKCTFCDKMIAQGTGKMYVKKDGKIFWFCSNKCQKNALQLKRKPAYIKWTGHYIKGKETKK